MTNFERIKRMSEEEMAIFISILLTRDDGTLAKFGDIRKLNDIREWLNQPDDSKE